MTANGSTPILLSSDANQPRVISLWVIVCIMAAICREESVPEGEKNTHSSFSLKVFF
jgi:hypothetical protein